MQTLLLLLIAFLTLAIVILIMRLRSGSANPAVLNQLLQELNEQQGRQLQQTTTLVLQQLNRQQEAQDRNSHLMHTRIDSATRVVSDVQGKLLQLEESNKRIFELGKDITSLQKILQAPKLRGGMGEVWLGELISQIIPADRFKMQYAFKSGEVCDAVIFLRDGTLLAIDSKFSLENFVKMIEAEDALKPTFRRQFGADIKKRIDEIAKKYIRPQEGTLEFAFMYVPAENVYYQAFIQEEDSMQLLSYAFERHVVPVSPSSFYAYLQVILFGLRGMEIEKSAKEIQKNLSGLKGEFERFRETYEKVGAHLRHAQQSYDQTDKRLNGIENKFVQISSSSDPIAIPETEDLSITLPNE